MIKYGLLFLGLVTLVVSFSIQKQIVADPTDCIKEKCPDQYAKCQTDPKCPTTLQKCQNKCNKDTSCWKWCLVQAGDGPAEDVAKCAAANHCLDSVQPKESQRQSTAIVLQSPASCMGLQCPIQSQQCSQDLECKTVLANCTKKCNLNKGCWQWCFISKDNQNINNLVVCAHSNSCY